MKTQATDEQASLITAWPDADPDHRFDLMDSAVGAGKVPHYLYFLVGPRRYITEQQADLLRRQFFGNRPVDKFDIELHVGGPEGNVLRIRRAPARRLTAMIDGELFPLTSFYDKNNNKTHYC